ncbi:arylalkylamine N-acetyltransferase 1 [Lepeophtheirus salmonis]|uniref:arylalkylamine N-acetyltransferase 1 n=1 Tax=Lepeophtheirus salmonis TaxID=72036 RepID=UPI001AEA4B61|nr:uncharacterized protein LOC121129903 [Lepeophtheirus salmonis]
MKDLACKYFPPSDTFSFPNENIASTKYKTSIITPTNFKAVLNYMDTHFWKDEPMVQHLNFQPYPKVTDVIIMDSLKKGTSIMITDKHTQSILAVGINGTLTINEKYPEYDDTKFMKIIKALNDLYVQADEKHGNIFKLFETTNFFEISHLSVAKEARGRGLCKEIIKETLKIAKKLGFQAVIVEATANHSRRALLHEGFIVLSEFNYEDYTQGNNRDPIFKGVPHEKFSLMVKKILT